MFVTCSLSRTMLLAFVEPTIGHAGMQQLLVSQHRYSKVDHHQTSFVPLAMSSASPTPHEKSPARAVAAIAYTSTSPGTFNNRTRLANHPRYASGGRSSTDAGYGFHHSDQPFRVLRFPSEKRDWPRRSTRADSSAPDHGPRPCPDHQPGSLFVAYQARAK